jgi:hypothetical protein
VNAAWDSGTNDNQKTASNQRIETISLKRRQGAPVV